MQFLYVLKSSPKDFYYEQFFLSAASLKNAMPDANIVLLCDLETKETLVNLRSGYQKFVCKTIAVKAPGQMSSIQISRWLKTSMRRLVSGDFLFIDCDTIVTDDLSEVFDLGITFGACLDKHSAISNHPKNNDIISKEKKLGISLEHSNRHFNSGVIFCSDNDETHRIFSRWHELWLLGINKSILRDQTSFNIAIQENASFFTELDGTWNCQITFNGLHYLAKSKIIHYFASGLTLHTSPFILASNENLNQIKQTGIISETIWESLKNPKSAFCRESRIIAGRDMLSVANSELFELFYFINKKIPVLFSALNCFCRFLKKSAKFFLIKSKKKNAGGINFYD